MATDYYKAYKTLQAYWEAVSGSVVNMRHLGIKLAAEFQNMISEKVL